MGFLTRRAQVAVWNNDRVLLIRNSYRETYAFPGGYIRNGENTAAAASRELCEETGIPVPTGQLRFSFAWSYTCGKLEGHDDIYECQLENEPSICIDNREVIEARFVTTDTALALSLDKHVRHYLESAGKGNVLLRKIVSHVLKAIHCCLPAWQANWLLCFRHKRYLWLVGKQLCLYQ